MGQSLSKVYIHITFSTKHRVNLIDESIEEDLYAYLGGICRGLECYPIQVGGYQNYVHILCKLSKNIAQAILLETVKKQSSKWIKTKGSKFASFYWQDGYGAFSVNPSELVDVVNYIKNQKAHHQKKTFQEEYLAFLNKYDVEYDERYV